MKYEPGNIRLAIAAASLTAVAFAANIQAAQAGANPQEGQCKSGYVVSFGQDPLIAKALWTNQVMARFGENWAQWPAAKSALIVPYAEGGKTKFRAQGKPCYDFPEG